MKSIQLSNQFALLAFSLCMLSSAPIFGQNLSRTETGKWITAAAFYLKNPSALKDLTEEYKALRKENEQLKFALETNRIEDPEPLRIVQKPEDSLGVRFKVQVGAFVKGKAPRELLALENVNIEAEGNLQKLLVGNFETYDEAQQLQSQLKTTGIKDAWIVGYRDGMRVPLAELEAQIQ